MTVATRALIICLIVLCASAFAAEAVAPSDVKVTAEGFAACPSGADKSSCRHAALADALRRAVENAVGVTVEGQTRIKNFMSAEDTVRMSSEGFVRDYAIVGEGLADGMYRVKIDAVVAPGKPADSLKRACTKLRDGPNPKFGVEIEGLAGTKISNELAALGLTVTTKKPSIIIKGSVSTSPAGERFGEMIFYAYGGSTEFSVVESKSGMVIPSVDVTLAQPIPGDSNDESKSGAVRAVCSQWIERNIPIIASALLDPGEPVDIPADTHISSEAIEFTSDPSASNLIPSVGERLILKAEDISALAAKLKTAVDASQEFGTKPVDIAVSRFKGIGISNPASVEDVLEDLGTALVKTGVFRLVERTQLDQVLRELKIQSSALVDSATAKKLGKLVGARAVLVGSISDRKDCVVINARLINTETGLVGIAESIVIDKETEPKPRILRAGPGGL